MQDTVVLGGTLSPTISIDVTPSLITLIDGEPSINVSIDGTPDLTAVIDGESSLASLLDGEAGAYFRVREGAYPAYTGSTEVTPSNERQVLHTADHSVLSDIVVNPIPSNYGLITWDGSTITVS